MSKYAVETCFFDKWQECWSLTTGELDPIPVRFNSKEEAEAEIDKFIDMCRGEHMDVHHDDYRVVEVEKHEEI